MRLRLLTAFSLQELVQDLMYQIQINVEDQKCNATNATNCLHLLSYLTLCCRSDFFLSHMSTLFAQVEHVLQIGETLASCTLCKEFQAKESTDEHGALLVCGCKDLLTLETILKSCHVTLVQTPKFKIPQTNIKEHVWIQSSSVDLIRLFIKYIKAKSYEASQRILAQEIAHGTIDCKLRLNTNTKELKEALLKDNGWEDAAVFLMLSHVPMLDAVLEMWPYESLSSHEHNKKLDLFRSLLQSTHKIVNPNKVLFAMHKHDDYVCVFLKDWGANNQEFLHAVIQIYNVNMLRIYRDFFPTNKEFFLYVSMHVKLAHTEELGEMVDYLFALPDIGFQNVDDFYNKLQTNINNEKYVAKIMEPLLVCRKITK